tara:strand:+ start:544 stop:1557 length:1014 start_codon:yes stop_codon:yes gene_type:complete
MSEKTKKTADLKKYMQEYRQKNKVKCPCGGSFNQHTAEKHGNSVKHQKYLAKEKAKLNINEEEIIAWLKTRFEETSTANENSKTKRTDKNTPIFKMLFKAADEKTYDWMLEHRLELVKKVYATPSSQQTALSTLKIVLDHVKPLTDELKQTIYKEGVALSKQYKETTTLKEDGMSYEELKKYESSEDPILAMFAHLYAADVPALRLSEWVNTSIGKNSKYNQLILSTGKYTARITKTNAPEYTFKLPDRLIKWLRKIKANGPLFGAMSSEQVSQHVVKVLGKDNGSRYWRKKYVSDVVSKMSGAERTEVAKQMGHSVQTQVEVYQKDKPIKKSSNKV